MSKIGVKRIKGESHPKTGQKVVYSVVEWYPETPILMRDVKQVTWELFKKRANGEYTTTHLKKPIGEFTFHEGAYGSEYMVEGYLKTPEKKGDTIILITPQLGPPSLIKIELLDSNHKLLKKGTLHYGQTLLARVYCTNMMGKPVKITLLEDDEPGAGHNEKNNRNVMDSQTVTVDRNGVAEATFLLSPAYIIKANKYGDGNTDKQHEYYVLAECENQQKASRNNNVDNPTYKPPVKTIPEIATEKVQNFLKEKLNVLRDILHDLPLPQTKNKAVVEAKRNDNKKEDDKNEISKKGYYIDLTGEIKYVPAEDSISYYIQTLIGGNTYKKVATLVKNEFGLVEFPASGHGFGRYGGIDKGGKSKIENVGKGDHYLLPETAAALYGLINEIAAKGWKIDFGDMSSYNGSDPTSTPDKPKTHHAGHGHRGKQSGLNIDFRYLNKEGISFRGTSNDIAQFDDEKNKLIFEIAYNYGFNKNYATRKHYKGVNPAVPKHYDHGHLGTLSIKYETVAKPPGNIVD